MGLIRLERFVAAITIIPQCLRTRPFQLSNWFNVCSRSSSATHSAITSTTNGIDFLSIKITAGAFSSRWISHEHGFCPNPHEHFYEFRTWKSRRMARLFHWQRLARRDFTCPCLSRSTPAVVSTKRCNLRGSLRIPLLPLSSLFLLLQRRLHQRSALFTFYFFLICRTTYRSSSDCYVRLGHLGSITLYIRT